VEGYPVVISTTPQLNSSAQTSRSSRSRRAYAVHRTAELLRTEIQFIANPEFAVEEEHDPVVEAYLQSHGTQSPPADLPAHLIRMCEPELLSKTQEAAMFREMNRMLYCANVLRSRLDPEKVNAATVAEIDKLLQRATTIRNHIIRANIRLVISIVKKFVTPQQSFDEMLSDGVVTLMQAVEKFDFDRGFRFSTYAYRSVARNAFRCINAARKEEARFTRDAEDWAFQQEDQSSSSLSDQMWSNLRSLTAGMLDRLDRRERLIIRSRYALGAHRRVRTFQDLGNRLGISKERVRQIEHRAVEKLKAMAEKMNIDELSGAVV